MRCALAVAPGHPFARLRSVPVAKAAAEPFVGFTRKDYPEYFAMLGEVFGATGDMPRIIEEHEGSSGLIAAIEAGGGVALVSQSLAASAGDRIRLLPLTPAPPSLVVGTAWHHRCPGMARLQDHQDKTLAMGQASRGGRHQDLWRERPSQAAS